MHPHNMVPGITLRRYTLDTLDQPLTHDSSWPLKGTTSCHKSLLCTDTQIQTHYLSHASLIKNAALSPTFTLWVSGWAQQEKEESSLNASIYHPLTPDFSVCVYHLSAHVVWYFLLPPWSAALRWEAMSSVCIQLENLKTGKPRWNAPVGY